MLRKVLTGFGVATALMMATAGSANAQTKLVVGTAAAKASAWGEVFKTWKAAVEQKTSNGVTFEFHFGSTKGTEATMIDKIKAGELDGAAVTSVGLGKLDKRLLTMSIPGVIRSWKTVDAVRDQVGGEFEKYLTAKGVTLVTWGDIGYAHFLSTFPVHTPDDLKGHNPWVYAEDPVLKAVYSKIPGVNPFPAELMAVIPAIESKKVDCMSVSALAADMLQWKSKFTHGVDAVNGIVVGAVILSTPSLDKLPADAKAAVVDTGKAMGSSAQGLKEKIRKADAKAWDDFKASHTGNITTLDNAQQQAWAKVFKEARDSLKGSTFDAALVSKIESIAAANP